MHGMYNKTTNMKQTRAAQQTQSTSAEERESNKMYEHCTKHGHCAAASFMPAARSDNARCAIHRKNCIAAVWSVGRIFVAPPDCSEELPTPASRFPRPGLHVQTSWLALTLPLPFPASPPPLPGLHVQTSWLALTLPLPRSNQCEKKKRTSAQPMALAPENTSDALLFSAARRSAA